MEDKTKEGYRSDGCRSWGDLQAAYTDNPALKKLASSIFREAPKDDSQGEMFNPPPLVDMAAKDDISLMDLCPFGLDRKPRFEPIKYSLSDVDIVVQGGTDVGMATVYDYDIILYLAAHLTREMDRVKKDALRGKNPQLPPRIWEPDISSLLKFCRKTRGGKSYKEIEASLGRLVNTTVSIHDKDKKSTFRRSGSFPLISRWLAVKRNDNKELVSVQIEIGSWMYDGIVRPQSPTVIALHRDYFLHKDGILKALHRFATKVAPKNGKSFTYSIDKVHHQLGSKQELRYFTRELKKKLKKLEIEPLPNYKITFFSKGKGKNFLTFQFTGDSDSNETQS